MVEPVPLLSRKFEPRAVGLLSAEVARFYKAIPISVEENLSVLVAVCAPQALDEIRALINRDITPVIYRQEEILQAIEQVYHVQPPEPASNVDETAVSVELDSVLERMKPALKRRPSVHREAYSLVAGEADLPAILADEFLALGATAQKRLLWTGDGIYEELNERMYVTSAPPPEHFPACLRRLRVVAGLPEQSRGPSHVRFEMDFGGWPFVVYAAFTDDAALLEFHPKA